MDDFPCVDLQNVDSWSTCAEDVLFITTYLDRDTKQVKSAGKISVVYLTDSIVFSQLLKKYELYLYFASLIERLYFAGDCITKQTNEMIIN